MIAFWNEADRWHAAAQQAYGGLKQSQTPVVTTSFVLLECGNAAVRRAYRPAVKQWRMALAASDAIIEPTPEDQLTA
jgi:predicted nucleic acid-binding protein